MNSEKLQQKGLIRYRTSQAFVHSFIAPFLVFFIIQAPLVVCGQGFPYGERFKEWANDTWQEVASEGASGQCENCQKPTLLGRKKCFRCMQHEAPQNFKQWCNDNLDAAKEKINSLRDPKTREELINEIQRLKQDIQDRNQYDSDYDRAQKRLFLESLGKMRPPKSSSNINEIARESIRKYLPGLDGTDYSEDPAKSISYLVMLDGIGFIKNVKCIRGPFGNSMTLLEAYEYYYRTDPQKAEEMLEIINDFRKIANPGDGNNNEQLPALLDALARTFRLLERKK